MSSVEMDDVGEPLNGSKSSYKKPTKTKLLCRGMGSCPTITIMIIGIVLMILGVLAIITGPSCACSKALPNFKKMQNSTEDFKCSECKWLWLDCKVGGRLQSCSRGCVLNPLDTNKQPTDDDICLPQTGNYSSKYKYNTISPIQIIGVVICTLGIIIFPIALCVAYSRGKHYLL